MKGNYKSSLDSLQDAKQYRIHDAGVKGTHKVQGNVDIKQDAVKWEVAEKGRLAEKLEYNEKIKFILDIKIYLKIKSLVRCKC